MRRFREREKQWVLGHLGLLAFSAACACAPERSGHLERPVVTEIGKSEGVTVVAFNYYREFRSAGPTVTLAYETKKSTSDPGSLAAEADRVWRELQPEAEAYGARLVIIMIENAAEGVSTGVTFERTKGGGWQKTSGYPSSPERAPSPPK